MSGFWIRENWTKFVQENEQQKWKCDIRFAYRNYGTEFVGAGRADEKHVGV